MDTSTFGKTRSGACTNLRLPIGDIREWEVKIRTAYMTYMYVVT